VDQWFRPGAAGHADSTATAAPGRTQAPEDGETETEDESGARKEGKTCAAAESSKERSQTEEALAQEIDFMPNIGQFVLRSIANPPLKAGDYTLQGRMDIAGGPTEQYDGHLRITSPRYSLPPDQMLSTFPPANSEGAYENRLPQIVIKRRTLPWERAPEPGKDTTPWLALVVIAEGEGTLSAQVPIAECVTPGVTLTGPNDVATGIYLGVSQTVVNKIFPREADLPLLCHVREVDIRDTELANGDDDGFLAVVMANRLPQFDRTNNKPVRYLACLINLEGQLGVLPTQQPNRFDFLATDVVYDVRVEAAKTDVDTDRFVMGGIKSTVNLAGSTGATRAARATGQAASSVRPAQPTSSRPAGKNVAAEWSTTTARIEKTALTAKTEEASRVVRDVMLEGYRFDVGVWEYIEPLYRFPVLAYWSFTVSGTGGFESLMRGLDVGLLGTAPAETTLPPGAPPPPPPPRPEPELTETGHVGLPHLTRRGERVRAWYRGPLASHPTVRDAPRTDDTLPMAHASDQLRRVVPDGREDLSLAAAFEIGRLLALAQPSVVRALLSWRAEQFGAARAQRVVGVVSEPASRLKDAFNARAHDLGALIGRHVLLAAAEEPAKVLAPSRPLVDPGRPLPYARDGGLETLIADGFGFSADAIARESETVGPVAALRKAAVPVTRLDDAPVLEGPQVERLRTRLTDEVERLAAQTMKAEPPPTSRRRRPRTAPAAAAPRSQAEDALDVLIRRAERTRGKHRD
jgi:hypothetical protein